MEWFISCLIDFCVWTCFWLCSSTHPSLLPSFAPLQVGIEDCLHIEFEYDKQKYHLKDVILGTHLPPSLSSRFLLSLCVPQATGLLSFLDVLTELGSTLPLSLPSSIPSALT